MDRLFIYSILQGNTEERARDFLTRHGIDYLIVSRDGTAFQNRYRRSYSRVLLWISESRVSKIDWG